MTDRQTLENWLVTEKMEHEDAADEAFAHVFASVAHVEPSANFVDVTTRRVWGVASRQRRLSRMAWVVAGTTAAAAATLGLPMAAPVGIWTIKVVATALSSAAPWLLAYSTEAIGLWWLVGRIGNPIAAAITSPPTLAMLVGLELVGVLAFYAMHRVITLGDAGEVRV